MDNMDMVIDFTEWRQVHLIHSTSHKSLKCHELYCCSSRMFFRYIRDFEGTLLENNETESETEYIDRLVGNPLHAFNLIRRFTIDIPNIEKDLKQDDWKGEASLSSHHIISFPSMANDMSCLIHHTPPALRATDLVLLVRKKVFEFQQHFS